MTFPAAVAKALKSKGVDAAKIEGWLKQSMKMSLTEMRKAASSLGAGDVHFDWEAARSSEGYYRIKGSTDFCIQRAIAFGPYADCIWNDRRADGIVHLGSCETWVLLAVHYLGRFPL